jgi:hypothetical protein
MFNLGIDWREAIIYGFILIAAFILIADELSKLSRN